MTPVHRLVAEAIRSHASPMTAAATANPAYAGLAVAAGTGPVAGPGGAARGAAGHWGLCRVS